MLLVAQKVIAAKPLLILQALQIRRALQVPQALVALGLLRQTTAIIRCQMLLLPMNTVLLSKQF